MYYPKSKIIPNQFTNGNEYVVKNTGQEYIGYYHILANNTLFSGKNPNDGIPLLLVSISEVPIPPTFHLDDEEDSTTNYNKGVYDLIRERSYKIPYSINQLLEPKYSSPSVDYPSFIRYFVKRTNNNVYIEINKSTYDAISSQDKKWNWAVYFPFNMPWTTSSTSRDDVFKTNRDIVLLTEQRLKLYGFSNYITNYTEFYI